MTGFRMSGGAGRGVRMAALAVALGALLGAAAQAQDANKILEQGVKASGGSKILSKVLTESVEGTFATGEEGVPGTFTLRLKQPNRYYLEMQSSGKAVIDAYNGKSAWRQDEGELTTLRGAEAQQLEAVGILNNSRLMQFSKLKIAAQYGGEADVLGKKAQMVNLRFPTGVERQLFFDAQSHLLAGEKGMTGGIEEEIYYSGYKSVSGVMVPQQIEVTRGGKTYNVKVTNATVNGPVGERVFDFPKKAQVELPDLKKLFEELDANQKETDKIKESYAGSRTENETEYDKNGNVTKKESHEYTFFYLDGDEISTLVKKDGKALSEEEQKKENEKTQKEIESHQKEQKKKEEKEAKAKEEGKEDKDEPGIEVFLRAAQFVNPRRERFRGQDVLVFDFEPNPDFKAKKMEEKIVQDLAGVIWVDEKAHTVARLEAHFVKDFHLAGGVLANLQKGTNFVFEQGYVNNEVWLPTYMGAFVGVRVLLVKGMRVSVETRYFDYKKFNVETLGTIGKPAEKKD